LVENPKNRQALPLPPVAGSFAQNPPFRFNDRECARPYSHWTFLVDSDAWQFGGKAKLMFYIFCLHPPEQKALPHPMILHKYFE